MSMLGKHNWGDALDVVVAVDGARETTAVTSSIQVWLGNLEPEKQMQTIP
jgi:hypothetical protein